MKRIIFVLMVAVTFTCILVATAAPPADEAAASIGQGKLPDGYRDWRLISVAREEGTLDDIRAVLGNDVAIKAYRQSKPPFPEGGVIEQAGTRIELALMRVRNVAALQKAGENYFVAGSNAGLSAAEDRVVKSGYLEMSGVNPVEEMVELIAASRAYEANVRIIQQHDTATSELITRLLRA